MKKVKIAKALKPEDLTAICDTREQMPLDLSPLKSVRGTLTTGDYSVRGLEHVIAVERKSLQDLVACVGRERERFEKEVMRLLAYPVRALCVEAHWSHIEQMDYKGIVPPTAVLGSLMGWMALGLPVIMAGTHQQTSKFVSRFLFIAARRRYHEGFDILSEVAVSRENEKLQKKSLTGN